MNNSKKNIEEAVKRARADGVEIKYNENKGNDGCFDIIISSPLEQGKPSNWISNYIPYSYLDGKSVDDLVTHITEISNHGINIFPTGEK